MTDKAAGPMVVTKEMVAAVLSEDAAHRRAGKWPLLGEQQLRQTHKLLRGAQFAEPLFVAHPPKYDIEREGWRREVKFREKYPAPPKEGEEVRHGRRRRRGERKGKSDSVYRNTPASLKHVADVRNTLYDTFPVMQQLFKVAGRHMVVAGGCVVSACQSDESPLRDADVDADFFFVGLRDEEQLNALLLKLLQVFETNLRGDGSLEFLRNAYVVTVRHKKRNQTFVKEYQFVLRMHDRIDQIIGNFDLGAAAIGWSPWTGIFATPLAAFSIGAGCLIVDPSRRSLTYESRLVKYVNTKNFQLLLPSLHLDFHAKPILVACDSSHELQIDDPVGVRIFGRKPHRDPNYLVYGYDDDDENGESGRRRRGRTLTHVRQNKRSSRDKYGLDNYARLMLRNLVLACKNDPASELMLVWETSKANDLFREPRLMGLNRVDDVFRSRSFLKATKFSLPMLRFFRNWYGEKFLEYIKGRMHGDRNAAEDCTDQVVQRCKEALSKAQPQPLRWTSFDAPRQYSPSFDRVFTSVRTWYPRGSYDPLYIGLPLEIGLAVTSLRLFHPGFRSLTPSVYRYIVRSFIMPHYWLSLLPQGIWSEHWIQEDAGGKKREMGEEDDEEDDDEDDGNEDADADDDDDDEEEDEDDY